jgi:hypothetical protein
VQANISGTNRSVPGQLPSSLVCPLLLKKRLKAWQDSSNLQQKGLDLIIATDRILDAAPEPAAMLTSVVDLLADQLDLDFYFQ